MTTIVFLGFGNVNNALCNALIKCQEITVKQIFNRKEKIQKGQLKSIPFTSEISKISDADVYIIGITDDAIETFSEKLPFENRLVVHTSGNVAMNTLSNKNRRGVFYPLQTFTKNTEVDFTKIPICIEAENENDFKTLNELGALLSEKVTRISSKERSKLHVAAVFVNNFTNYLYSVANEFLEENNIDFDLLKPLIKETAAKIENVPPKKVQTGPAKRNDTKTIENHLHLLRDGDQKEIYKLLTKAIQNAQREKL